METKKILIKLENFSVKHNIKLIIDGEVGFGRKCVGFLKNLSYVQFNPIDLQDYEPIEHLQDVRLYPPNEVTDAYHKIDCLCVLVHDENYEKALYQLYKWVVHLESLGEVEVVSYENKAEGIQTLLSGKKGYAVKINDRR